eukprot:gb/GECG01001942.1/.p1 GENE.gb/GECG01001942.1/~~gb/GECG01001942.1/.p1  ORF type:complete len:143 (+),score=7.19 gb/GECG01001942.1/:1-429(+)
MVWALVVDYIGDPTMQNDVRVPLLLPESSSASEESRPPCVVQVGLTPLHVATLKCHIGVIKVLLENCGIEVNIKNNSGRSALHYASTREPVVLLASDYGADAITSDSVGGDTPLHRATKFGVTILSHTPQDGPVHPARPGQL